MRRLTLLIAGGVIWLFLAALPALADGGPHVYAENNGSLGINSDNCAGCHRAHTAQGEFLLKADENLICTTCHGAGATGATVNVELGVQYAIQEAGAGTPGDRDTGTVAGALRGGGYLEARIDSGDGVTLGNVTRTTYPRDEDRNTAGTQVTTSLSGYVPVAATGAGTTSAHLDLGAAQVETTGIAWGNGGVDTGIGPEVELHCASCHNPHGNGNYRILNPIPSPDTVDGTTPEFAPAGQKIFVNEVRANPTTGTYAQQTRNYTVKWGATLNDVLTNAYPNAASPAGDYWRLYQPWNLVPTWSGVEADAIVNPPTNASGDQPEFIPGAGAGASGSSTRWRQQMTAWCSTCHTRYNTQQPGTSSTSPVTTTNPVTGESADLPGGLLGGPWASGGSYNNDSGDDIYKYRHGTQNRQCTICHVAHGSNAPMPGNYSGNYPYPHDPADPAVLSDSSRLLKVPNRGTCQLCHDPTGTLEWDDGYTPTNPFQ